MANRASLNINTLAVGAYCKPFSNIESQTIPLILLIEVLPWRYMAKHLDLLKC